MEQISFTPNPIGAAITVVYATGIDSQPAPTPMHLPERPPQLLVVDDDAAMRRLLTMTLKQEGYAVVAADSGEAAFSFFATHTIDLVLLDVNMPGMDGHAICTELRRHSHVPIIFVTASARTDEMIQGFQLGADHYITKPFTVQELRARILSVLARVRKGARDQSRGLLRIGEIELNEDSFEVFVCGQPASLTPNEFRLLRYLMQRPDQLISKNEFQSAVWGYQASDDINFMRVTMRRLRMKIEKDPSHPRYLKTIHGVGYQFCSQPSMEN